MNGYEGLFATIFATVCIYLCSWVHNSPEFWEKLFTARQRQILAVVLLLAGTMTLGVFAARYDHCMELNRAVLDLEQG